MKCLYKSPFKRFVKKQSRSFQLAIEDEVEKVSDNPQIGEVKSGDLTGFSVHKFKFQRQEYLIAYRLSDNHLIFYMVGTHENFYRDLKRYLKEVRQ